MATLFLVAARDWLWLIGPSSRPLPRNKPKRRWAECDSSSNKGSFFFFMGIGPLSLPPFRRQLSTGSLTARCWLYSHRGSRRAVISCGPGRLSGLRSPANRPCRRGDFPLECLIAFGAAERFRLVYPWIAADDRVRACYHDFFVVALTFPIWSSISLGAR